MSISPTTARPAFVPHCADQRTLCATCGAIVYDLSQSDSEITALYERMSQDSLLIVQRATPAPEISWSDARGVPMDTEIEHYGVNATRMMLLVHRCTPAHDDREAYQRTTAQNLLDYLQQISSAYVREHGRLSGSLQSSTTEVLREYVCAVDRNDVTEQDIYDAGFTARNMIRDAFDTYGAPFRAPTTT